MLNTLVMIIDIQKTWNQSYVNSYVEECMVSYFFSLVSWKSIFLVLVLKNQVHKKNVFNKLSLEDFNLHIQISWEKIAGRKRPVLIDPSHKVRQEGKGSVWDGQTYERSDGHF